MTGTVTDAAFNPARDAHLFAYADHAAWQRLVASSTAANIAKFYEPVTAEDTLSNCCGNLLCAIGLEAMCPEQVEQLRRVRAHQPKPTPEMVGTRPVHSRSAPPEPDRIVSSANAGLAELSARARAPRAAARRPGAA